MRDGGMNPFQLIACADVTVPAAVTVVSSAPTIAVRFVESFEAERGRLFDDGFVGVASV